VEIHNGFDKTRKDVRAADVRASVMPLFNKYGRRARLTEIPCAEVPKPVYSLPLFLSGSADDIEAYVCDKDELMFMTGSGFGHWGILVCKDEMSEPVKDVRYKTWGDGIFFFSEYK
jgi:hypothetical protein